MHTFEVWAPLAHTLEVRIGSSSHPMEQSDGDWWRAGVQEAQPGTDYSFVVDGGEPVPDPRSRWQPEGVNGPSRIVDDSSFRWTDQNWQARPLSSAVIYELHVGTFTPEGTFKSTIERLDYLVSLGITHVELMPLNEFSGPWGWGYDGVDLYAPHHAYGTPDDLKTLVNSCHAKGLAVLLDVVYNHFGPAGNYLGSFGPYLTEAYKTPWGAAVNLDHEGSHEVRRFFIDNALMWMRDYHFDGLRLDAVHAFLIAESDLNDPRIVRSREAHGYGIDAHWNDEFHHALHSVLTGEQKGYYQDFGLLEHLAKSLRRAYV
jgi:maltooligosyltrehalose trehalohydrolase